MTSTPVQASNGDDPLSYHEDDPELVDLELLHEIHHTIRLAPATITHPAPKNPSNFQWDKPGTFGNTIAFPSYMGASLHHRGDDVGCSSIHYDPKPSGDTSMGEIRF